MTKIDPKQELNARRMTGSQVVLSAAKELRSLASGDVLKVVATDPGSVADVAAFSRSTGHENLDQSEGGGEYTFLIRKA